MNKEELKAKLAAADKNDNNVFTELLNASISFLNLTENNIADEFGVSRPTVARWKGGINQPHPAMRPSIFKHMIDLLDGKLRIERK